MIYLYYFLQLTWGIVMNIIGLLIAFVLRIANYKSEYYHGNLAFKIGDNWGGISFGFISICSSKRYEEIRAHEFGHSLQNCLLGPLMPLIVGIPSVIRYWYREFKYYRKGLIPPTKYDDIWFEGQATRWGNDYAELF